MHDIRMILKKPPISKSPLDWQLGDGWLIKYNNTIPFLQKLPFTIGSAVIDLPLPGKYKLKLIGDALGTTVNGTPVTLNASNPVEVIIESTYVNSSISIYMDSGSVNSIIITPYENEFYIDGVTNASLIFDSRDIRTPNKASASRSRNITIPPTENNLRAFGELFEVNHEGDYDPRKRADCHITVDSVTVLNGYLQIVKINRGGNSFKDIKSIEVQVFDNLSDFLTSLGSTKISDLSFSEYSHNLNDVDITRTGWRESHSEHLVKKNGSYISNYNHIFISDGTVTPEIEGDVRYYRFTTSTPHGLSVGDFVWIQKTTSSIGDHRKHIGEHRVRTIVDDNNFIVTSTTAGGGVTESIPGVPIITNPSVNIWKREALGFGYVYVPADLGLDSDIALTGTGVNDLGNPYNYPLQSGEKQYQVTASRMRPSVFLKEVIFKAAKYVGYEVVSAFFDNDQDFQRIVVLPWHSEGIDRDGYNVDSPNYKGYNSSIDPSNYLPSENLSDFIGDVFKMFNLYVQVIDKKLHIEPRDSFYTNKVIDWNSKIDQKSITISMLPEHTGSTYEFSPANSNDIFAKSISENLSRQFGSVSISAENEFNTGTVTNKLKVIEPVITVSSNIEVGATYITTTPPRHFYTVSSKAENGKPLRKGVRLAYVSSKGTKGKNASGTSNCPIKIWKRWSSEGNGIEELANNSMYIYPAATHVDSVSWPMYDLNFATNPNSYPPSFGVGSWSHLNSIGKLYVTQGIYEKFYSRTIKTSTSRRSRLISGKGLFNLHDVSSLDFRSLISFDAQLYQLNKFDIDLTTMVGKLELLLVQDLGSTQYTGPIEAVSTGTGKVVETIMSVVSDLSEIDPNDSVVIDSVDGVVVPIGKPSRPLQELKLVSKTSFQLQGKEILIDGSADPVEIGIGETKLWSRDGINWEIISKPSVNGISVTGTEPGKPLTGLIQIRGIDGDDFWYLGYNPDDDNTGLIFKNGVSTSALSVNDYMAYVHSTSPSFTGLAGNEYWGTNVFEASFIQQRYLVGEKTILTSSSGFLSTPYFKNTYIFNGPPLSHLNLNSPIVNGRMGIEILVINKTANDLLISGSIWDEAVLSSINIPAYKKVYFVCDGEHWVKL